MGNGGWLARTRIAELFGIEYPILILHKELDFLLTSK